MLSDLLSRPGGGPPLRPQNPELFKANPSAPALLLEPGGGWCVPVVRGFALSIEGGPDPLSPEALCALEARLFGDPGAYARFARHKWRRPAVDTYAAFQPFNESTRALWPLLPLLRARLRPGDRLLDVWGRTGWTAELLAGLFPEQHIVSLWEGPTDVLGLRGYAHWLGQGQRAPRLSVVFHNANTPLPFPTGHFAAVVALDCLHRYDATVLPDEAMRVCRSDGLVLYPHVHMANSRPEPFFDRGGHIQHGAAWRAQLSQSPHAAGRAAFVMAELDLFSGRQSQLTDNAGTPHYNGVVVMAPPDLEGADLGPPTLPPAQAGWRAVLNPLIEFDLHSQVLRRSGSDAAAGMLRRHPAYGRHLDASALPPLNELQVRALHLLEGGMDLANAASALGCSSDTLLASLQPLAEADALQLAPVSAAMARLHTFYRSQRCHAPEPEQTLNAIWAQAVQTHSARPWVIEPDTDEAFTYQDAGSVVDLLVARLARSVVPSSTLAVWSEPHVEAAMLLWAAARCGLKVAYLDPGWPAARARAALARCAPDLLFTDDPRAGLASAPRALLLDTAGQAAGVRFADWLYEPGECAPVQAPLVRPDDVAVVLFTSGTTGEPKAVQLTHRGLVGSARLIAEAYDLGLEDRLLSSGSFHAMSGLRNPVIATALAGAAAIFPGVARQTVLGMLEVARRQRATLLSVVPAFVSRWLWLHSAGRLLQPQLPTLRATLCTASTLPPDLKAQAEQTLGTPIFDYYGLTETSGICALADPDRCREQGSLGRPVAAVAQLLDDEGEVLSGPATGTLRLFTRHLMAGYLDPEATATRVRGGWLYTGDRITRHEDGSLTLLGRHQAIFKAADGERLALPEIAALICALDGVLDCTLIPFEDDDGIERIAAQVELRRGASPEGVRRDIAAATLGALGHEAVPRRFTWRSSPQES